MRLTQKDKRLLMAHGYTVDDFPQIERACRICKITKGVKSERITHKNFIKNWGREKFILTLARATFHYASSFIPEKNIYFIFDCFKLFEKQRVQGGCYD